MNFADEAVEEEEEERRAIKDFTSRSSDALCNRLGPSAGKQTSVLQRKSNLVRCLGSRTPANLKVSPRERSEFKIAGSEEEMEFPVPFVIVKRPETWEDEIIIDRPNKLRYVSQRQGLSANRRLT